MQSMSVIFYDGVISKPHQAELKPIDAYSVMVQYQHAGQSCTQHFDYAQMSFIGSLGQKFPVIELDNDARIEFLNSDIPEWLNLKHQTFQQKIWKLERTPVLIVFSAVVIIALAGAMLKWGIPYAAYVVAKQMPADTLSTLGDQAEEIVIEYTEPSQLAAGQQQQIRSQYLKLIAEGKPAKLIFRGGGLIGANALALPNNTIIMTDELVEMAHSDQEILGVLAHEQGHLIQRHSLQQAIASLGFSVIFVAITGDSSDLFTSLPVAIAGAGYSRKFEQQADLYALNLMDKKNIEVSHFANFLERLGSETDEGQIDGEGENPDQHSASSQTAQQKDQQAQKKTDKANTTERDTESNPVMSILDSHPATDDRIKMVRQFEAEQQAKSKS
ncbi:Zn-dependent protease with chaperone function [Acinetobacter calcoaceticus]|uniref:Zn-dependent protease with chaperone function n=1 Tax=Acinetobacter calcoaceticus TaxID=471 RepID=A0A4R1X9N2_ACICA|nr:Zn-dependent protease with chaperone function [Acinetobacter calcoaceticus]